MRRNAWKQCRSCSADSDSKCLDSLARCAAGGMDALALGLEDPGDRVLGEPVDLQIGVQSTQLARDRNIALGVPKADRRADEERARATVRAEHGWVAWRAWTLECVLCELAQHQVEADGLAGMLDMSGAFDRHRACRAETRERAGIAWRVIMSRSPETTSTGQSRPCASPRSSRGAPARWADCSSRTVAANVFGSVSSAQPTPSSIALVECGSGRALETNHSANTG